MPRKSAEATITPEAQLRSFVEKFDLEHQKVFRSVRSAVRKRLPSCNELVYDYAANLVIGYSPTERPTDGSLSISLRADGVRLYFAYGKKLSDPKKLLKGSGTQTRFITVDAARRLAHPDVEALISAELAQAAIKAPPDGHGKLLIRSDATKRASRQRKPTSPT